MELFLDRTIRHGAFSCAVSHDLHEFAISGSKDIKVYSVPDFEELYCIPVKNVCTMVFLSDNRSILILNTSGILFFWDGSNLKRVGHWPVPEWYETPMHYGDDAHIFWGNVGGVWKYDAKERSMNQVFSTEKDVYICSCDHGIIKVLLTNSDSADEGQIELLKLAYSGEVLSRKVTKDPLKIRLIHRPVWSDDMIAISAIAAPHRSKPVFERVVKYQFTPEGRAILKEDIWSPEPEGRPHCMLYLLDTEANILDAQKSNSHDGNLYCGNGILAKCCTDEECVVVMRLNNLQDVCYIRKNLLTKGTEGNPPTFAWFGPDDLLVIGSWHRLFVFRIVGTK